MHRSHSLSTRVLRVLRQHVVWMVLTLLIGSFTVGSLHTSVFAATCLRSGYVRIVRADNGNLVGYVPNFFTNGVNLRYGVTSDANRALAVTFDAASEPFDITATNGPDSGHPFFGFVIGPASSDGNLAPDSPNYALAVQTNSTPVESPPALVGN